MELPVRRRSPRDGELSYLQPLTLADPFTRKVQAGRPPSVIETGPLASTVAVFVALALIVAAPSAPMVASLVARVDASRNAADDGRDLGGAPGKHRARSADNADVQLIDIDLADADRSRALR